MLKPWEQLTEDPSNLSANDTTFTAWIEASCPQDQCSTVRCDFQWFSADGGLGDNVEAGALDSWTQLGPVALQPPEEGASSAVASGRFERSSPALKGSCAFVRRLAGLVLKVRIRFSSKSRGPSPVDVAQRPPASTKAKSSPAPIAKPDSSADLEVHELQLPLAPLILPGRQRHGAEPGAIELEPPEVIEDAPASMLGGVLESLRIGVRCNSLVMSEEVAAHLNPLLISVNSVHRLPQEEHAGQQRRNVTAVLQAFGQRLPSEACALSARGSGRLSLYRVFFAGTWHQRELREVLQMERFIVEVHDRDRGPPGALTSPTPSPVPSPTPAVPGGAPMSPSAKAVAGKANKKKSEAAPPAATEVTENHVTEPQESNAVPPAACSHGVARFTLGELAGPRPPRVLELRLDLEPVSMRRRRLGVGGELQASTLFGEGGQDLLDSVKDVTHEQTPGYIESGSFVRLTVRIARPLAAQAAPRQRPPGVEPPAATAEATAAGPGEGATGEEAHSADAGDGPARRHGFSRMVVVADYGKVSVLKRLLAVVAQQNVAALALEPVRMEDYLTRAAVELTKEQRNDPNLDILTGFILMDRNTRIVVIEGLRDGPGLRLAAEALGVGAQRDPRCKVLANANLAWSHRLYGDFGICLKQIKLRQPTLSALTQQPDVCLSGRAEQEAAAALQCLMAMRQAERLQVLTKADSFPGAGALLVVETQYGQFVTDEERDCKSSLRSRDSKSRCSTALASAAPAIGATRGTLQGGASTIRPEDLPDSDEEAPPEEPEKVRTARPRVKAPLDTTNAAFAASLSARAAQPVPSVVEANKAFLREISCENEKANVTLRNVGPRKKVDVSFLEGQTVHIYSGQKYNSAELQKQALRAAMQGQEGQKLWTYSVERNSGCFPMLEKEVPLDKMLRQSHYVEDSREPFRYPKQRQKEEFRKPVYEVSEARKEDLASPWIENQLYPELEGKEVIRGCFDAKTLGTGGAHVIPERRPGHHPPGLRTPPPEREPLQPPMRLGAKAALGLENLSDKYTKSILDGEPRTLSLCFEQRSVPRSVTAKFGRGTAPRSVEVPPLSLNLSEQYVDCPGNSDCLTNFMRDVARPVAVPHAPATARGASTSAGRTVAAAAANTRGALPPASARERGSSERPFLARFAGTQSWSARVGGGCTGSTAAMAPPVSAR